MTSLLFAAGSAILCWAMCAKRLEHWRVPPALVFAFVGVVTAIIFRVDLAEPLYSSITERTVEMVLALLLFIDATEVRGGLLGPDRGGALRLIFVALPLSLAAATLLGVLTLPASSVAVVLMIACAVMPTDFAPLGALFANDRVPERVRHLLNVEGGYNDGVVAPIFIFALALVEGADPEPGILRAVWAAVESAGVSVLIGVVVGVVFAKLANAALAGQFTSPRALGIAVIMAALLTYGIASVAEGNGFVAAFVCGIFYRLTRDQRLTGAELEIVEDVALLCNLLTWFAFGLMLDYVFDAGALWSLTTLFVIAAVTFLRFLPVQLSMIGSGYDWRERMLIAGLGPRGTASVVFGLLAWTKVAGDDVDDASLILIVVAWTVALSLILHSGAAVAFGARKGLAK